MKLQYNIFRIYLVMCLGFFFALQVGNVGGKEFSESLAPDVQKLLVGSPSGCQSCFDSSNMCGSVCL